MKPRGRRWAEGVEEDEGRLEVEKGKFEDVGRVAGVDASESVLRV